MSSKIQCCFCPYHLSFASFSGFQTVTGLKQEASTCLEAILNIKGTMFINIWINAMQS